MLKRSQCILIHETELQQNTKQIYLVTFFLFPSPLIALSTKLFAFLFYEQKLRLTTEGGGD